MGQVPKNCEIITRYVFNRGAEDEKSYASIDLAHPIYYGGKKYYNALDQDRHYVIEESGDIIFESFNRIIQKIDCGRKFYIYKHPVFETLGIADFSGNEVIPTAFNTIDPRVNLYGDTYFFVRDRSSHEYGVLDQKGRIVVQQADGYTTTTDLDYAYISLQNSIGNTLILTCRFFEVYRLHGRVEYGLCRLDNREFGDHPKEAHNAFWYNAEQNIVVYIVAYDNSKVGENVIELKFDKSLSYTQLFNELKKRPEWAEIKWC